ncbi:cytochrome P450 20A1-like [Watersipora subatra]|uniref:cytochrome P450 20A1-like n=1 Tax=Watersipora subatra TaxID=2589382 RepID=UPI00355B4668
MILPFVLFAVFIVIALLVFLYSLYPGSQRVTTVPGLDPTTEVDGNVPDMQKAGSLPQFLINLHEEFGPVVSFWINRELIISVASPETHKAVAHLFDRPYSLFEPFLPLLGDRSIQLRNGPEGQHDRKLHDRSFTQAKIVQKFSMIQQICEELCDKWESVAGTGEHMPLSVNFSSLVMKSLTRFCFGDYFKDEEAMNAFTRDYNQCFHIMEQSIFEGPMVPGSEKEKRFNKAIKNMREVAGEIISARKEAEIAPEDKIFIDTLLDTYTDDDMVFDDIVTYLIGGSHTTSYYLTWAFCLLAKYQDVQEKAWKEVDEYYVEGPVTVDIMKNMKYLQNVMNEVMRYSKLAPYSARKSSSDCIISGHKIPKETPIIISAGTLMQNGDLWENPDEFDPDRFNKKIPAYGFEPFGFAGKRKCPGYRLTELESQMFIVLALKRFKVTLVPGQVVEPSYGLVTKPSEEIWILVEKRK